jgi:hypothetical protein
LARTTSQSRGAPRGRAALFALAALTATPCSAAAAPSFTTTPAAPVVCQPTSFEATPDPEAGETASAYRWDLDGDGTFEDSSGPAPTHVYRSPGMRTVGLEVTYSIGDPPAVSRTDQTTGPLTVQAASPTASFSSSPRSSLTFERITFSARSSVPAGQTLKGFSWDLDGDGVFGDASGPAASAVYPFPGPRIVSLRARSGCGEGTFASTAVRTVVIGNRLPTASIRFLPSAPRAGDRVDFISLARDPDGPVVAEHWDLDNDGRFDDAAGPTASRKFDTPGARTVSLRAYDASGARASAFASVDVTPKPAAGTPKLLSPFPVVRIVGALTRTGARIKLLSIRLPRGVKVTAKCKGRGCPYHRRTYRPKSRGLRLRKLERSLRAGTGLKIYISKPGRIGKYTAFKIRRGKAPKRRDLCLRPGARRATRCPSD